MGGKDSSTTELHTTKGREKEHLCVGVRLAEI